MFVRRVGDLSDQKLAEDGPVPYTFAEIQQLWHLWRRQYVFVIRERPKSILSSVTNPQPESEPEPYRQVTHIDELSPAWGFTLSDARGEERASVSRAFRGIVREV